MGSGSGDFFSISKKFNNSYRPSQRKIKIFTSCYFKNFYKSRRGFILISLVVLLPFLITLSFLFFSLVEGIHEHTKALSLCYQSGASIQKKMQSQIRQLVSFNPLATTLRLQRNFYRLKLISTVLNPIEVPFVLKKINNIKKRQKEISLKQEIILKKGQEIFSREVKKLDSKFKKIGSRYVQSENDFPMALKKQPSESDSPNYVPMEFFSEKQQLTIKWRMNLFQYVPMHIKNIFGFNKIHVFECSVSLSSLNNLFSIQLMKGRRLI